MDDYSDRFTATLRKYVGKDNIFTQWKLFFLDRDLMFMFIPEPKCPRDKQLKQAHKYINGY